MLARAVLFELFQAQIVQFFVETELFELPLEIDYGFFDPLLTFIASPLALLILDLVPAVPPVPLLVLLDSTDLLLEVDEAVSQVLYHHVLALELVLHYVEDLVLFDVDASAFGGSFSPAGISGLFLHELDEGVIHLRRRGLDDDTPVQVALDDLLLVLRLSNLLFEVARLGRRGLRLF